MIDRQENIRQFMTPDEMGEFNRHTRALVVGAAVAAAEIPVAYTLINHTSDASLQTIEFIVFGGAESLTGIVVGGSIMGLYSLCKNVRRRLST